MLSAVLFIAVYPYQTGFWGGLLASGCLAALIGGLADWFAVSALFHKPLGIPWRTEIVPRNRERLFGEIVRFTADDLLSAKNIGRIIRRYHMAELIIAFLETSNGKEKIKVLIHDFMEKILAGFDFTLIGEKTAGVFKTAAREVCGQTIFLNVLQIVKAKRYDDKAIWFFIQEIIQIIRDEKTKRVLTALIEKIKLEYEGDSSRRQVMGFVMNFSSVKLADILQEEIIRYLITAQDPSHHHRVLLRDWLSRQANRQEVGDAIERWREGADLGEKIAAYLTNQYHGNQQAAMRRIFAALDLLLERKVREFKANSDLQAVVDAKIKKVLLSLLENHHDVIIHMVEARLRAFSNDELVAFIEDKIADDLQMIRINGSLVGALAGMALYVIEHAAEGMWR